MREREPESREHSEVKNIIEAALLSAEEPLTVRNLKALFPQNARPTTDEIGGALRRLESEYGNRGIELRRVGKGYRFQSREKYAPWLRKLNEGRPPRYSRATLETLAIIAYRQPVTRGDIEDIRGVGVSVDIMRALLSRGWIKEVGHRDVPGHPALFGTTADFLAYFNLRSLSELPPLKEKREPAEVARELNLRLPLESANGGVEEASDADFAAADAEVPRGAEIIPLTHASRPDHG